jgi:NifU-like protein involved in Fe-S cluster formation
MKDNEDWQQRVSQAMRDPKNMGELADADSVGTVGNASCGEMLRLWVKFREEKGQKVIDRATFQSFGCETAIAVASLATELIRGKTAEQALALSGQELAGSLGPLPPMKIHCAQLVEGALQAALKPEPAAGQAGDASTSLPVTGAPPAAAPGLLEQITQPQDGKVKVVFLKKES